MSRPTRQIIRSRAAVATLEKRRRTLLVASLAVLALIVIVALARANRVPESASVPIGNATLAAGDKAPEFALSTTNGLFDLKADAAGKPTLLEIFATWCPHCQREAPVLSTLYHTYKKHVNFVAVNGSPVGIDQQPETQNDVVEWAQHFSARYPVAFDPTLDVARKYLEKGFPTVVLIGADGKVQSIREGEIPASDLVTALNASLAGKTPDPNLGAKSPSGH